MGFRVSGLNATNMLAHVSYLRFGQANQIICFLNLLLLIASTINKIKFASDFKNTNTSDFYSREGVTVTMTLRYFSQELNEFHSTAILLIYALYHAVLIVVNINARLKEWGNSDYVIYSHTIIILIRVKSCKRKMFLSSVNICLLCHELLYHDTICSLS